jgi:hypothetical protein
VNSWLRRLLIILTVGGGFTGVAFTVQFFAKTDKAFGYLILVGFIVLYGWGVFIGIKLSEGPAPLGHLRAYFAFQIPFILSPIYVYRFCSGFHFTIALIQSGLQWDFRLGSEMQFAFLSQAPWGFGINLFAVAIIVLLYSRLAGELPREET